MLFSAGSAGVPKVTAVKSVNMNQAFVYYCGHRYHRDLIMAHIHGWSVESSTPINKVKNHIVSSGWASTYTVTASLSGMDVWSRWNPKHPFQFVIFFIQKKKRQFVVRLLI